MCAYMDIYIYTHINASLFFIRVQSFSRSIRTSSYKTNIYNPINHLTDFDIGRFFKHVQSDMLKKKNKNLASNIRAHLVEFAKRDTLHRLHWLDDGSAENRTKFRVVRPDGPKQ